MKRIVMMFSVMILVLSLFGQNFTQAAPVEYTNIAFGEHTITAKALNADSNEASGAASFIQETATLKVSQSGITLTLTVPHNDMAEITGMQIEGAQPTKNGNKWTFKIATLKPLLNAKVQYEVPALNMEHDVPFRFSLAGLDNLPTYEEPEVEEPKPEKPEVEQPETEKPEVEKPETEKPEQEKPESLENGYYTVGAAYLQASKDEASSMGRYLSDSVFVHVQNGKMHVTVTVNDHKTVTKLTVDGKNATTTKLDGNTRYETFVVNNLDKPLTAYVEYQAPYGGSVHYGNATFRLDADLASAKTASANDQPGAGISGEYLTLEDGLYSIDASFINAKNDQASAMARYLGDKAYLSVKDGKVEVYILINDNGTVTKLKVNDQDSLAQIVNGKKTLESFTVNPLLPELTGYAEYQAPFNGSTHYGKATFNILLNKATIQKVAQLPIKNEEPKEEPREEKPKEEKPKEEIEKTPVKGYTIDYVVKHATKDEASAADNFFVKPGTLLKKDGKNYLEISIKNWSMIDWIKVNGQSVTVVEEDKVADTAVIQFQVPEDLNQVVQLSMKVKVPGLYETEHDARLVFDAKSLVEDKSGREYIVHAPSAKEEPELIKKPDLGANGSNGQATTGGKTAGKQSNPQTGDNSNIILYSTLLLLSVGLLAVQYRKRRMNV